MNEEELKKLKENVPQMSKGGDEAFETLQSIEKPKSKKTDTNKKTNKCL